MKRKLKIQWLAAPEDHDYPAALSYLTLLYDQRAAQRFVKALKASPVVQFKAKDIFRASRLPLLLLGHNIHVDRNQMKIRAGEKLSPVLLVRDAVHGRVIVADGYHRVCAVYLFDEDAVIPCKIV